MHLHIIPPEGQRQGYETTGAADSGEVVFGLGVGPALSVGSGWFVVLCSQVVAERLHARSQRLPTCRGSLAEARQSARSILVAGSLVEPDAVNSGTMVIGYHGHWRLSLRMRE